MQIRIRAALAAGTAALFLGALFAAPGAHAADPLIRSGIGLASCDKIAAQLKPGAGLDHLPNALMFYWTQGYLSAANIRLLNEYTDYIDVGIIEEPAITQLIVEFCAANPDKRPVNGLDQFIVERKKITIKESEAFDPWEH